MAGIIPAPTTGSSGVGQSAKQQREAPPPQSVAEAHTYPAIHLAYNNNFNYSGRPVTSGGGPGAAAFAAAQRQATKTPVERTVEAHTKGTSGASLTMAPTSGGNANTMLNAGAGQVPPDAVPVSSDRANLFYTDTSGNITYYYSPAVAAAANSEGAAHSVYMAALENPGWSTITPGHGYSGGSSASSPEATPLGVYDVMKSGTGTIQGFNALYGLPVNVKNASSLPADAHVSDAAHANMVVTDPSTGVKSYYFSPSLQYSATNKQTGIQESNLAAPLTQKQFADLVKPNLVWWDSPGGAPYAQYTLTFTDSHTGNQFQIGGSIEGMPGVTTGTVYDKDKATDKAIQQAYDSLFNEYVYKSSASGTGQVPSDAQPTTQAMANVVYTDAAGNTTYYYSKSKANQSGASGTGGTVSNAYHAMPTGGSIDTSTGQVTTETSTLVPSQVNPNWPQAFAQLPATAAWSYNFNSGVQTFGTSVNPGASSSPAAVAAFNDSVLAQYRVKKEGASYTMQQQVTDPNTGATQAVTTTVVLGYDGSGSIDAITTPQQTVTLSDGTQLELNPATTATSASATGTSVGGYDTMGWLSVFGSPPQVTTMPNKSIAASSSSPIGPLPTATASQGTTTFGSSLSPFSTGATTSTTFPSQSDQLLAELSGLGQIGQTSANVGLYLTHNLFSGAPQQTRPAYRATNYSGTNAPTALTVLQIGPSISLSPTTSQSGSYTLLTSNGASNINLVPTSSTHDVALLSKDMLAYASMSSSLGAPAVPMPSATHHGFFADAANFLTGTYDWFLAPFQPVSNTELQKVLFTAAASGNPQASIQNYTLNRFAFQPMERGAAAGIAVGAAITSPFWGPAAVAAGIPELTAGPTTALIASRAIGAGGGAITTEAESYSTTGHAAPWEQVAESSAIGFVSGGFIASPTASTASILTRYGQLAKFVVPINAGIGGLFSAVNYEPGTYTYNGQYVKINVPKGQIPYVYEGNLYYTTSDQLVRSGSSWYTAGPYGQPVQVGLPTPVTPWDMLLHGTAAGAAGGAQFVFEYGGAFNAFAGVLGSVTARAGKAAGTLVGGGTADAIVGPIKMGTRIATTAVTYGIYSGFGAASMAVPTWLAGGSTTDIEIAAGIGFFTPIGLGIAAHELSPALPKEAYGNLKASEMTQFYNSPKFTGNKEVALTYNRATTLPSILSNMNAIRIYDVNTEGAFLGGASSEFAGRGPLLLQQKAGWLSPNIYGREYAFTAENGDIYYYINPKANQVAAYEDLITQLQNRLPRYQNTPAEQELLANIIPSEKVFEFKQEPVRTSRVRTSGIIRYNLPKGNYVLRTFSGAGIMGTSESGQLSYGAGGEGTYSTTAYINTALRGGRFDLLGLGPKAYTLQGGTFEFPSAIVTSPRPNELLLRQIGTNNGAFNVASLTDMLGNERTMQGYRVQATNAKVGATYEGILTGEQYEELPPGSRQLINYRQWQDIQAARAKFYSSIKGQPTEAQITTLAEEEATALGMQNLGVKFFTEEGTQGGFMRGNERIISLNTNFERSPEATEEAVLHEIFHARFQGMEPILPSGEPNGALVWVGRRIGVSERTIARLFNPGEASVYPLTETALTSPRGTIYATKEGAIGVNEYPKAFLFDIKDTSAVSEPSTAQEGPLPKSEKPLKPFTTTEGTAIPTATPSGEQVAVSQPSATTAVPVIPTEVVTKGTETLPGAAPSSTSATSPSAAVAATAQPASTSPSATTLVSVMAFPTVDPAAVISTVTNQPLQTLINTNLPTNSPQAFSAAATTALGQLQVVAQQLQQGYTATTKEYYRGMPGAYNLNAPTAQDAAVQQEITNIERAIGRLAIEAEQIGHGQIKLTPAEIYGLERAMADLERDLVDLGATRYMNLERLGLPTTQRHRELEKYGPAQSPLDRLDFITRNPIISAQTQRTAQVERTVQQEQPVVATTTVTTPPPPPLTGFGQLPNTNSTGDIGLARLLRARYVQSTAKEYRPSITAITFPEAQYQHEFEEAYVPGLEGIEVRPLREPRSATKAYNA